MSNIQFFGVLCNKSSRLNPAPCREGKVRGRDWLISISTGISSPNLLLRMQRIIYFSGKEIVTTTKLSSFPGGFSHPVE